MKPVTVRNAKGQTQDFHTLRQAIDWLNDTWGHEDEFERVTVRIPKASKDRLRRDKKRYGVPMSSQVVAFYLKGRNS